MGVALSPDGRWVYVGLGRSQAVGVIDTTTKTFSRLIENVGQRVWGVATSPDGRTLYTANGPGADEVGSVKRKWVKKIETVGKLYLAFGNRNHVLGYVD
jgi:YVTN family beta-propeller protein